MFDIASYGKECYVTVCLAFIKFIKIEFYP